MILQEATIQYKGYDPNTLSKGSSKRICVSCDICGRVRWVPKQGYHDLCKSCVQKHPHKLPKPKFIKEKDRFIPGTGIDRILTIEKFEYDPIDLMDKSNRKVIRICKNCGKVNEIWFSAYRDFCLSCAMKQKEILVIMSCKNKEYPLKILMDL